MYMCEWNIHIYDILLYLMLNSDNDDDYDDYNDDVYDFK
jgi:hypothetical protein